MKHILTQKMKNIMEYISIFIFTFIRSHSLCTNFISLSHIITQLINFAKYYLHLIIMFPLHSTLPLKKSTSYTHLPNPLLLALQFKPSIPYINILFAITITLPSLLLTTLLRSITFVTKHIPLPIIFLFFLLIPFIYKFH